jgi:hypothetical protein
MPNPAVCRRGHQSNRIQHRASAHPDYEGMAIDMMVKNHLLHSLNKMNIRFDDLSPWDLYRIGNKINRVVVKIAVSPDIAEQGWECLG